MSRPGRGPEAPPDYSVRLDWRGESAYYIEPERQLWLFAAYWGGTGSLEHINAVWEYADGRRIPLTPEERRLTLTRVLAWIRSRESFPMKCAELEEA